MSTNRIGADTTRAHRAIDDVDQRRQRSNRNVQRMVARSFAAMNVMNQITRKTTDATIRQLQQNIIMAMNTYSAIAAAGPIGFAFGAFSIGLLMAELWALEMGHTKEAQDINNLNTMVQFGLLTSLGM